MPSKNVIKLYIEGGHYHVYNRGVEKRTIFQDTQDYNIFLNYLKTYLTPEDVTQTRKVKINNQNFAAKARPLKNYHQKIELLAYCLMPNHFHLLLKQKNRNDIEFFMRSLSTKYSGYFNRKYDRVGPLFQGAYKAVLIEDNNQLLHVSRYIHLNPYKESPLRDAHSSYVDYLAGRKTSWVNTKIVLSFFKTATKTSLKDVLSYESFVEDYLQDPKEIIGESALD